MVAKIDLTGKEFGYLLVRKFHESKRHSNGVCYRYWECECHCGNLTYVTTNALTTGNTKSCGCTSKARTHGFHNTRIYQTWADMKVRCDNPDNDAYCWYGAKGITYQESWAKFENFYEDMKENYTDDLTLDRIDPSKNYCKENCRWVTKTAQTRNRGMCSRNNTGVTGVHVWYDGKNGSKYYVASCKSHITRKLQSKHFSVNKYGEEFAFFLACEQRDLMIRRLNLHGAGYTENHGK